MLGLTICFSVYLFEDNKLTASICPKSMSCPSRNMNKSLQTYFFFWYPSKVLSPCNVEIFQEYKNCKLYLKVNYQIISKNTSSYLTLNFDRILANSLLIRFTSASLLLQFRMSEIKTARPRIPSPLTAGISMVWYELYYPKSRNVEFVIVLNIYLHESFNINNILKNNTSNYGCLQTRHFEATARANRFSLLPALELLTFCLAPLPFWFSTFSSFA